ncbi:hypothetical protein BMS3Bbin02_01452 [bacterium BMS3Bbin02]|nr:hypothetical protein BMS3Bbin02_01452 [bacterium BMS3Bbin02]
MTSPRYRSSKSISISGIERRPGFRNLSKMRPNSIGSIFVMPRQYAMIEPAADPRPGPVRILASFA